MTTYSNTNEDSNNIFKGIFKNNLKIEPKVMAIETLFNNERRLSRTNYSPYYQRNYVWDDAKATYFVETILLGTEIPPLIFFNDNTNLEVIDGRQRYETIKKLIQNKLRLKSKGLFQLKDLAGKQFEDLDEKIKDVFFDTKLRIIEFSLIDNENITDEMERRVKIEIFKRYNTGITPLKGGELNKAKYTGDPLTNRLKEQIEKDHIMRNDIDYAFNLSTKGIEDVLKKVRELLVQVYVPVRRFAIASELLERFYDFKFVTNEDCNEEEELANFNRLLSLTRIAKSESTNTPLHDKVLFFECIFWALSVLKREGVTPTNKDWERITELLIAKFSSGRDYFTSESAFLYQKK